MNIGVIFAGGTGKRMHTRGTPKQFLEVDGKPIIIHTLYVFERCRDIDAVVVACLEPYISLLKEYINTYGITKVLRITPGGGSGQESIYNGLREAEALAGEAGEKGKAVVLIHDGVRPLITEELLSENIRKTNRDGNAITVAPAVETIFYNDTESGEVSQILDRSSCYVAKAPQTFFLKDILKAHEWARENNRTFVDSATLMKAYGFRLYTVESTRENIKVTTPSDYYLLKAILQEKKQSEIFGIRDI